MLIQVKGSDKSGKEFLMNIFFQHYPFAKDLVMLPGLLEKRSGAIPYVGQGADALSFRRGGTPGHNGWQRSAKTPQACDRSRSDES